MKNKIYKNFNNIKYDLKILSKIVQDNQNILITGGSSVDYFFKKIIEKKIFKKKYIYNLFLSDERISSKLKNTNYKKINELLKKKNNIKLYNINNFPKNLINETNKYSKILEKRIDVAFLSLGDNYHIASLFYNYPSIYSAKFAAITYSNEFKFLRISVNQKLLSKVKKIYLFLNGINRLNQFKKMVEDDTLEFYFKKNVQKKIYLVLKDIKLK